MSYYDYDRQSQLIHLAAISAARRQREDRGARISAALLGLLSVAVTVYWLAY
ncbi:MAG: hypothetical protein H6700_05550 [Myxococcales bacterium]|nr:hypothetical protein [Myxococcales bacterium]MCB9520168.1 hypothetical protein [Myxococcales bacterium]MCB9531210.1 hypothetical protein [Myxococcales bacterium]